MTEKIQNPYEVISRQMAELSTKMDRICEMVQPPPVQEAGNRLLTTDQVAQILSVSRVCLWNWRKKNILKPMRIGNLLRYREADVMAMSK